MRSLVFTCLVCCSLLVVLVKAWPGGAPEAACDTLMPKHGNNKPKPAHASPYALTQTKDTYRPGDRIKVTLKSPQGISFRGLMVQAFDPDSNEPVGTFEGGRGLKILDRCAAVTHTDRRGKRTATLLWRAPQQASGRVRFRATVVRRFSDFYQGLQSDLERN